ncbi:Transcriptional regulator SyrR [Pseudomonas syringae pv. coriandricola]|uniref:Transcriptional regulator SyrR n=1 Tax=Pseudomonas syringae pv. coriandricola TaxID=264453 RepID=A0A3M4U188_9PSED|nr:Transcriptional regulator SyrR [Pseudomonas syringae pv. coriandricola]RMU03108.1 Transcriptional regulator SyrR [Pseudomonas syringae pv. coriandricola]
MNTAQYPEYSSDPRFYQQLAQLVSSTGCATFAGHMLQLVDALVPIHGLGLSEWTLDLRQSSISRINLLGGAGLQYDPPTTGAPNHPLLPSILHMQDPLLVQLKTPLSNNTRSATPTSAIWFQARATVGGSSAFTA